MKKNNFFIIFLFLLFLPFLSSHLKAEVESQEVNKIIACVNNEIITQKDLDDYIKLFIYRLGKNAQFNLKDKLKDKKFIKTMLEKLINDKLILLAAREEFKVIPQAIEDKLNKIIAAYPSREDFESSLISSGLNITLLKKKIENDFLMQLAVKKYVEDRIKVSPTEVTAYYQNNKDKFISPLSYTVYIVVSDDRKTLEEIAKVIDEGGIKKAKKVFPDKLSLTTFTVSEMKDKVRKIVEGLQESSYVISKIYDTNYFIYLVKKHPSEIMPFDRVKNKIISYLRQEKRIKRYQSWLGELRRKCFLKIYSY